jgi:hypothetical protein
MALNLGANVPPQAAVSTTIVPTNVLNDEDEENEDDEFAMLARRLHCPDANLDM